MLLDLRSLWQALTARTRAPYGGPDIFLDAGTEPPWLIATVPQLIAAIPDVLWLLADTEPLFLMADTEPRYLLAELPV